MSDITHGTVISPWVKPRGMHQAMARYQALKGLKPVGPHRTLADSLLQNITCKCGTCGGTGLHGTYGGMGWRICPVCHGLGEAYSITLEELQALRQQVLDRYPDAATPGWRPGNPISCPVQDIAASLMLDACPLTNHEPVQGELLPNDGGEAGTSFLPWGMCVREVPSLQLTRRLPAQPKISWRGLWVLVKVLWQRLS
jgi:hypothetical protein